MKVETTARTQELLLYKPAAPDPADRHKQEEKRLVVSPETVYVDYDKNGKEVEYKAGGRSWLA